MKPIEIDLSKKVSLIVATIAPAIFGLVFYIVAQLPVVGDIWWVVSPFALLLYWGWVAGMYYKADIRFIWSILIANSYGIISFVIYMIVYYGTDISQGTKFTDQIIFWFTYPLQFLTLSVGGMIHDPDSDAMMVASTQIYGLVFMLAAFATGYLATRASAKKQQILAEREQEELLETANLLQSPEFQENHTETNR
ncbi:MAG: hypothetical protein E7261_12780 [Lachnospiraceae bacterium]|nr:hypothetical protein [Lachnospiraceae bacterium]